MRRRLIIGMAAAVLLVGCARPPVPVAVEPVPAPASPVEGRATTYTLESAVNRSGPWTAVEDEFIPPSHGWLRFTYSAPMVQGDGPTLGSREPHDLPVQWEGDQTAYLDLSGAPMVFRIYGGRDRQGVPALGPVPAGAFLYRSEKPQLIRVTVDGHATPVYTLKGVPERMGMAHGMFYYQLADGPGFAVDLTPAPRVWGPVSSAPTDSVRPGFNRLQATCWRIWRCQAARTCEPTGSTW